MKRARAAKSKLSQRLRARFVKTRVKRRSKKKQTSSGQTGSRRKRRQRRRTSSSVVKRGATKIRGRYRLKEGAARAVLAEKMARDKANRTGYFSPEYQRELFQRAFENGALISTDDDLREAAGLPPWSRER